MFAAKALWAHTLFIIFSCLRSPSERQIGLTVSIVITLLTLLLRPLPAMAGSWTLAVQGPQGRFQLELSPERDTVGSLKSKINEKCGIRPEWQRLLAGFPPTELKAGDAGGLAEAGLGNGEMLRVTEIPESERGPGMDVAASSSSPVSGGAGGMPRLAANGAWQCAQCTLVNEDGGSECGACGGGRDKWATSPTQSNIFNFNHAESQVTSQAAAPRGAAPTFGAAGGFQRKVALSKVYFDSIYIIYSICWAVLPPAGSGLGLNSLLVLRPRSTLSVSCGR